MIRHSLRQKGRQTDCSGVEVEISEEGNIRSLHLGTSTIQSSMDLDDPARLVLSYSRSMMAWLLFMEAPKRIVQIGLGGGSFSRWLDLYVPEAQNIVVEINPQVIAVARNFFELPFENERFKIVEADGSEYIKVFRESVDVMMVDGFDGMQIVDALVTESFFADCHQALTRAGIFITNWWSGDQRYPLFIERLLSVFQGCVLEVPAASYGNVAVMAFKTPPKNQNFDELIQRSKPLSERFHLDFEAFVAALKRNNLNNGSRLSL